MSPNVGTSTATERFYQATEGWKEISTIAHEEITSLFELREDFYAIARGFLQESKPGKRKLYLLIAKQAIYVIKYLGRGEAARVSKVADLALQLEDAERTRLEQEARRTAAWMDAIADCGMATVGWVLGVYTGGVFLLVAGVGATARCGVSAIKLGEAIQGQEHSMFDTPAGQWVDIAVTAVELGGSVGGAYTSAAKAITYWQKAGQVMAPSIARYYERNAPWKLAKLLLVDFPGVGLAGHDLLTKYQGLVMHGWDLPLFLRRQQDEPRPPCVPFEPVFRSPTDWLRDTIEHGFVAVPWIPECRP